MAFSLALTPFSSRVTAPCFPLEVAVPMQRCVLFEQTLAGPSAGRADALDALRAAGFGVRDVDSPYGASDSDSWVVAEQVMRTEPDGRDQQALMGRVAEASERYGYALRMHAVVWAVRDMDGGA